MNDNNPIEFDYTPLISATHNKIAAWHNDDGSGTGLKFLAIELIDDLCGAAFDHMGLKFKSEIKMDPETRKKIEAMKANGNGMAGTTMPPETKL